MLSDKFINETRGMHATSCECPDYNSATDYCEYRGNDIVECYKINGTWYRWDLKFTGQTGWTKYVKLGPAT